MPRIRVYPVHDGTHKEVRTLIETHKTGKVFYSGPWDDDMPDHVIELAAHIRGWYQVDPTTDIIVFFNGSESVLWSFICPHLVLKTHAWVYIYDNNVHGRVSPFHNERQQELELASQLEDMSLHN
jgi:hypothetical protein